MAGAANFEVDYDNGALGHVEAAVTAAKFYEMQFLGQNEARGGKKARLVAHKVSGGVIEQLGTPYELYTNPQTTFVANFLGRSNLIKGTVVGREGSGADAVVKVDMHGTVASIKASRVHTDSNEGWIGIRPEKVLIQPEGTQLDAPGSHLPGAVVVDASYIGVSTEYTLRMPWGQEIICFEQNTGRRGGLVPVGTKVDVSWRPEFAFLLDSSQDATAGTEED